MKSLMKAVAIAAVLAAPVVSFAQAAGYNAAQSGEAVTPSGAQASQRDVQMQNPAVTQTQEPVADTSGYGGAMNGSVRTGGVVQPTSGPRSVYFGN